MSTTAFHWPTPQAMSFHSTPFLTNAHFPPLTSLQIMRSGSRCREKISCFYGNELSLALPPRWRTTPCLPSPTSHATYSQLSSIPGRCLLRPQPEKAPRRGGWGPTMSTVRSLGHVALYWLSNNKKQAKTIQYSASCFCDKSPHSVLFCSRPIYLQANQ